MSVARVYHTKKSRKVWTCGKCGTELPKGSPVLSFSVGFRGYEQRRCTKPECAPRTSELESSAVASVYAAIEDAQDAYPDTPPEDLADLAMTVSEAIQEVIEGYEQNPLYDNNYDLQDRVDMLSTALSVVEDWEPEEKPEEGDYLIEGDEDDPGLDQEAYQDALETWADEARESFSMMLDEIELP